MTIKVLEHNGIYTAYLRVSKRTDDGELYESLKRIAFPSPPPQKESWGVWASSLAPDELEVGIQIYFDKWNFGNGTEGEQEVYKLLYDQRLVRKKNTNGGDVMITGGAGGGGSLNVSHGSVGGGSAAGRGIVAALNFPVVKK